MSKVKKNVDLRTLPHDKRPRPTSGQHGKPIDLALDLMNKDEILVLSMLSALEGSGTVEEISDGFGKKNPKLRTRNAMRRLVRGSWVERTDRANYKFTRSGSSKVGNIKSLKKLMAVAKGGRVKGSKPAKKNGVKKAKKPDAKAAPVEILNAARVQEVAPHIERETKDFKIAALVIAACDVGLSDSKVASATGLSRGFVIPRLQRIAAHEPPISLGSLGMPGGMAFALRVARGQ